MVRGSPDRDTAWGLGLHQAGLSKVHAGARPPGREQRGRGYQRFIRGGHSVNTLLSSVIKPDNHINLSKQTGLDEIKRIHKYDIIQVRIGF